MRDNEKGLVAVEVGATGNLARQQNRVPATVIYDVRSYMFEFVETKEVLHIDRLGADDVARAIERLAVAKSAWIWVGDDEMLAVKLSDWRIKIMRDGAVVIKAGDYVLVGDSKFLLLRADEDGFYDVLAKGDEITWDGTEEFMSPADLWSLVKDTVRRLLEQTRWFYLLLFV